VSDERVYVGSVDFTFYCLDSRTGNELWRFEAEGDIECKAAVSDRFVYFSSCDGHLYCIKRELGVIKVVSSPEGGDVYIDGEYEGKTPLEKSIPPNDHIITVESDDTVETKKITLKEEEVQEVRFDFEVKKDEIGKFPGTAVIVLLIAGAIAAGAYLKIFRK
jgi:hypothetical protein